MPTNPVSVSIVTSMLLWLKIGLRFGGRKIFTFVIFALGSAAVAGRGVSKAAQDAAATLFKNDRRFM
jgi:hypothetical protein